MTIGDEYVVGYGLDFEERYRNLPVVVAVDLAVLRAGRFSPYSRVGRVPGGAAGRSCPAVVRPDNFRARDGAREGVDAACKRYVGAMVEVRLSAVRVDLSSSTPVVLLQETEGTHRSLPIFVGPPEATAIAFALQGVEMPRPMTHDLMTELIELLGARLTRVVVTELRESTFFAELHLRAWRQGPHLSCRPSDGIALATRTHSPLYVADELMDAEGLVVEPDVDDVSEAGDPEELVGEFKEFLDTIRPEDFST